MLAFPFEVKYFYNAILESSFACLNVIILVFVLLRTAKFSGDSKSAILIHLAWIDM